MPASRVLPGGRGAGGGAAAADPSQRVRPAAAGRGAQFGVLKLDQVRETGLFLTGIFPLLFVPAAAGVMELGSQLMNLLLPAVLAIVPITALVMAVTGMVAQKCAGGKEDKNG